MSAFTLRLIACITMLIDHIGYKPHNVPLRLIGRTAFPIFVYLIYNGFRHTSSKPRYALRLLVFALLSQIPYSLFAYGQLWHSNGNVFFTLFAALLCIWSVDAMKKHKVLRWFCLLPSAAVCVLYHCNVIASDYGAVGILMALVFYFCDRPGIKWKVLTCVGFLGSVFYAYLLSCGKQFALLLLGKEAILPTLSEWRFQQIFSVAALLLIFAYNGKKGGEKLKLPAKVVQYGFYLFYPVHQLILWLIRVL